MHFCAICAVDGTPDRAFAPIAAARKRRPRFRLRSRAASGLFSSAACLLSLHLLVATGCSSGNTTTASNSGGTSHPAYTQTTNFGASITCGYYATQTGGPGNVYSTQGYAALFDAYVGAPSTNLCRPGDQAADTVRTWVYPNSTPTLAGGQLYTLLSGSNDANTCGPSSGCLTNWSLSLKAAIGWLALPASDKVLGTQISTRTGSWTDDQDFGISTSDAGASLSFSVHQAISGRMLYLAYRVFDASVLTGGTAAVSIDGTQAATLSTTVSTGHPISTQHGLTDTVFLATIPLGDAGDHVISVTTGSTAGFFSLLWAGASTGAYTSVPGSPRVILAGLPNSPSSTLNATLAQYIALQPGLVAGFVADGMNVSLVPTDTLLDTGRDFVDTMHPNNSGHQKIALALEKSL